MPKQDQRPENRIQNLMLGFLCIKDMTKLENQVAILDRFGVSDKDIASICDAAVGTVRNVRVLRKKKPRPKARPKARGA